MRQMKIRVEDPSLLDELVHHLRRSGCIATPDVEANGNGLTVDVRVPAALDAEQARMEVAIYLKVFEVTHPGQAADLLT
jgi:hypothetical protein